MSHPFDILVDEAAAKPTLTIDLDALVSNYRRIEQLAPNARIGAVIKADAYGCGSAMVGKSLFDEGCDLFFVATPTEGAALRPHVGNADIYPFSGYARSSHSQYIINRLYPTLCSLDDIETWKSSWSSGDLPLSPALYIDTGMTRLGLSGDDVMELSQDAKLLAALDLSFVMSHLACGDTPSHPMNFEQLNKFNVLSNILPPKPRSLANSAGILLGSDFHFEVVRPGIALYGSSPSQTASLALESVAYLHAPILQVHKVDKNTSIGYGATYKVDRPSRIAVVGIGYADGYMRYLSNVGYGILAGKQVPIAGRVSMDLTAFDVTDVAHQDAKPGDWIELLGENLSVDVVGGLAGSFGYEILTSLGHRYVRRYIRNGALVLGM